MYVTGCLLVMVKDLGWKVDLVCINRSENCPT